MVITSCKVCGKRFETRNWLVQRGWGRHCSKKCRDEAQRKGKFVKCDTCGKRIWRVPAEVEASKSGRFFCDKSCQTVWRNKFYSGKNHALWTGGSNSYNRRKLLKTGIPVACKLCNEKDRRVLQVHHIDSNRENNEADNLMWLCMNCHRLVHLHNVSVS